jgi:hypothetical protein
MLGAVERRVGQDVPPETPEDVNFSGHRIRLRNICSEFESRPLEFLGLTSQCKIDFKCIVCLLKRHIGKNANF